VSVTANPKTNQPNIQIEKVALKKGHLIDAVGIEERPSFWISREHLTREALLDRLGEFRDKSPTLRVAVRHSR